MLTKQDFLQVNRSKNFTCAKRKVFDASKNINPGPG